MADKKASTILMEVETWEKLKRLADSDRRTMSAQIEVIILQTYDAINHAKAS